MKEFTIWPRTVKDHRAWSDKNFGNRRERGPVGPLKHLAKEVQEAIADPHDIMEFADMTFLLLDSLHRAGFSPHDLNEAMKEKMEILKTRNYPRGLPDEPAEHVRETA